ncbi:MAG: hypothetical protein ACLFVK_06905 [Dehalococcoidia bacterium]
MYGALNAFLVEMASERSPEVAKSVLDRIIGGQNGAAKSIIPEENELRFEFTYLFVGAGCIRYLQDLSLQQADETYKAIVGGLAVLAQVEVQDDGIITYEDMSQYINRGVLPVRGTRFGWGERVKGVVEVPADAVDAWLTLVAPSFCYALRRENLHGVNVFDRGRTIEQYFTGEDTNEEPPKDNNQGNPLDFDLG